MGLFFLLWTINRWNIVYRPTANILSTSPAYQSILSSFITPILIAFQSFLQDLFATYNNVETLVFRYWLALEEVTRLMLYGVRFCLWEIKPKKLTAVSPLCLDLRKCCNTRWGNIW